MKSAWQIIRRGLGLFTRRGRLVLAVYSASLVLLSALDAVALFLLTTVFQTGLTDGASSITLDTSATKLILIIVLFVARSILSAVVSWLSMKQFVREENSISTHAVSRLINPRTILSGSPLADFHNAGERGPRELMSITFHFATLIAECSTGLVIVCALVVFQPLTAMLAFVYFVIVALMQHRALFAGSQRLGNLVASRTPAVYEVLGDAAALRRLLTTSSATSLLKSLQEKHYQLAQARGMIAFLATIPRYFLELVFALGLVVIGGATYLVSGPPAAFAATTLFVAAGFRLLPVVNRCQALILSILSYAPTAEFSLVQYPTQAKHTPQTPRLPDNALELTNVSFSYPTSTEPVIKSVSLTLNTGKQYAIVGPSGTGKTTLVDLFLGLHAPQSGEIRLQPDISFAYVPQDTHIAALPLAQNIALTWNPALVDMQRVRSALEQAHLHEFLPNLDDSTPLNSSSMSGGQKQRIGLARAFYLGANFVVLDEVTSALDMDTERVIYNAVNALRGQATVVIIAHRLSTVQRADQVLYLDNGALAGAGTFAELSELVPEFRRQIELSQIDLVG